MPSQDPIARLLGEWSMGAQHIFDNTQDSGGCHIRVGHRLRAFEQASLGGTAHFRAHLLCLDRLDDTRHISHDELLVQRARAIGGDDNRHRDGQRQLDTVQLPQSDKGTDDLRRALGLRNPRIHDRRGTLYSTVIVYVFLLCILACFPSLEIYLKNRSEPL